MRPERQRTQRTFTQHRAQLTRLCDVAAGAAGDAMTGGRWQRVEAGDRARLQIVGELIAACLAAISPSNLNDFGRRLFQAAVGV